MNLSKDLFKLGTEMSFIVAHPTEFTRASQEALGEVLEQVPETRLTPEEVNHLATEWEERFTEGRIHRRAFRTNPHGE